jgi:hypothetical protein
MKVISAIVSVWLVVFPFGIALADGYPTPPVCPKGGSRDIC